jgi:Domain of unknown function (DUF4258)
MAKMKKALPYIFLAVLLVAVFAIRQYRSSSPGKNLTDKEKEQIIRKEENKNKPENRTDNEKTNLDVFRDEGADFYFTKHARCRMKCRHITQEEVKEIVKKASVNYNKSELDAPQGPKYALEGYTSKENQHVRIIVAPKERHLTIVTVIDLDEDWDCPSCK